MSPTATLYDQVVDVTYEYLGPAADRFVSRQVTNHLSKSPRQLRKKDLATMIDWFGLAMAHLCEDTVLVDKYVEALIGLTDGNAKKAV